MSIHNSITSRAAQSCAFALVSMLFLATAHASEKVLFRFDGSQSTSPYTGVISDSAGNLYGTLGGPIGQCSVVYELSPAPDGTYKETVLFTFQDCFTSGISPVGALSLDKAGNLYGAEYGFGPADGSGLVYELIKGANGKWQYKVLHNFGGNEGGPYGDFVWDSAGNLYGATSHDSTTFDGEVFELSPQPDGSWTDTILYTFPAANGASGPASSIVFDKQGNLYGTFFFGIGGNNEHSTGAVFELSPQAGQWKLAIVRNFTFADPVQFPNSKLIFDASGNLYGTSQGPRYGSVFELSPDGNRPWTLTTLHQFTANSDGGNTTGNLAFDANGNLYGVTYNGGIGCNHNLCGVVYKLAPQSDGTWKESVIHQFESATDGSTPDAGLFLDGSGNLYGTTRNGGSRYGYGTVYEIIP